MKLIEILVRFIKREDIPDDCFQFTQDSDGAVNFHNHLVPILDDREHTWRCDNSWIDYVTGLKIADDWKTAIVTMPQYEAALSASKEMLLNKPAAWDGQGLPPVGQLCDFYSALEGRWLPVQIEAVTKDGVAFTWLTDERSYSGLDCVRTENALFRPSLSAEEMARIGIIDNFIKIMAGYIEGGLKPEIIRERLYEHLPLLPGVRVESPDED